MADDKEVKVTVYLSHNPSFSHMSRVVSRLGFSGGKAVRVG